VSVSGLYFQNLNAYVVELADQKVLAFAVAADVKRKRIHNPDPWPELRAAKLHSRSHLQERTFEQVGTSFTYGIHRDISLF
jgi:hypothetical protein